ncbi:hypothetical protein H744_2c0485 [Photobacterium gaetbulicola Gung47]|uniref:Uncharacterized protein n=1 Tax=Photobacterium gaetbulicola Gung47 TaxID=658445 RepID=A0A0C5W6T2_9GAMM|nr:hypothetical protein H744_2c0485 [Photobacterium gaetbulicola Gung47]
MWHQQDGTVAIFLQRCQVFFTPDDGVVFQPLAIADTEGGKAHQETAGGDVVLQQHGLALGVAFIGEAHFQVDPGTAVGLAVELHGAFGEQAGHGTAGTVRQQAQQGGKSNSQPGPPVFRVEKGPAEFRVVGLFIVMVFHLVFRCWVDGCHVFGHAFGDGLECVGVTCGTQLGQIGLGKGLVAAFEVVRERNLFNLAFTVVFDHRLGDFAERLGLAGPAVEDTGHTVLPEPQVDLADIADKHKITLEVVRAFEQFRIVALVDLVVEVERHRGHAAFVLLARAVDIEVAEPGNLRQGFAVLLGILPQTADIVVEQLLGIAVDIECPFVLARFDEVVVAAAVGSGRGGVQERNGTLEAVMQQLFGILVVVEHHVLAVPLGGRRAGPLVKYRIDRSEVVARHDLGDEVFLVHVIGNIQIDQIGKFGAVFEVVDH